MLLECMDSYVKVLILDSRNLPSFGLVNEPRLSKDDHEKGSELHLVSNRPQSGARDEMSPLSFLKPMCLVPLEGRSNITPSGPSFMTYDKHRTAPSSEMTSDSCRQVGCFQVTRIAGLRPQHSEETGASEASRHAENDNCLCVLSAKMAHEVDSRSQPSFRRSTAGSRARKV